MHEQKLVSNSYEHCWGKPSCGIIAAQSVCKRRLRKNMDKSADEISGLTFIEVESENPFVLFKKWLKDANESAILDPNAFTLATSSIDGKVSARSLLLRRLDDDGVVFVTDGRSKKSRDLAENPIAAMVFLWVFIKDGVQNSRQVRIEGSVVELDHSQVESMYEVQPLYCKVRAYCCHQGTAVDWHEHKKNHDTLVREVQEGRPLPMPEHFVGYKLQAEMMEFYCAENDNMIADRVVFVKGPAEIEWKHRKIAA